MVTYTYVLYPVLLALVAVFHSNRNALQYNRVSLPDVSVLIACYNEELVIREKIQSILSGDYPSDKIEILVGSDHSTDNTDIILKEMASVKEWRRLIVEPFRNACFSRVLFISRINC